MDFWSVLSGPFVCGHLSCQYSNKKVKQMGFAYFPGLERDLINQRVVCVILGEGPGFEGQGSHELVKPCC